MNRPAIFEIHERSGKVYKIYASGEFEGFEKDVIVMNGITPFINSMVETKHPDTARRQQSILSYHGLAFRKQQPPLSKWQNLLWQVKNKVLFRFH